MIENGQLLQLERRRIADALRNLLSGSYTLTLIKAITMIRFKNIQSGFLEEIDIFEEVSEKNPGCASAMPPEVSSIWDVHLGMAATKIRRSAEWS